MLENTYLDKQDLVAEAAHVLRGLVNTILNNSGFIVRGIEPDLLVEDAHEILTASRQLSTHIDTVTEILECGIKEYNWMAVDVAQMVEETCLKIEQNKTLGAKEFRSLVSGLLPKVWADAEALCRVIELLLMNRVRTSKGTAIYIHAYVEDSYAVLTLGGRNPHAGSPIALPPSYRKNALGLELLLCSSLIELLRGSLWVTGQAGHPDADINLHFSIPLAPPAFSEQDKIT